MIKTALQQYGVNKFWTKRLDEIFVGAGANDMQFGSNWCGIFMSYLARKNNLPYPEKFITARSWLGVGEPVTEPVIGDIVVLWRETESSWKGHVGLYVSHLESGDYIYVLGGNQSARRWVTVTKFPEYRVLGYRRLQHV